MRKKTAVLIFLGFFMLSFMAACQSSAQKPLLRDPRNPQPQDNILSDAEKTDVAARLTNAAESIQGVDRATVILSDYYRSNNTINKPDMREDINEDIRNNINPSLQNNNNDNVKRQTFNIMVGLDLNSNVSNDINKVRTIKKNVASKLKASDDRIAELRLTTDPELKSEIDDMAAGLNAGKPLQDFNKKFDDLSSRLMEEMD